MLVSYVSVPTIQDDGSIVYVKVTVEEFINSHTTTRDVAQKLKL